MVSVMTSAPWWLQLAREREPLPTAGCGQPGCAEPIRATQLVCMDHGHDAVVGLSSLTRQRVLTNLARMAAVASVLLSVRLQSEWPLQVILVAAMAVVGAGLSRRYRYGRPAVVCVASAGGVLAAAMAVARDMVPLVILVVAVGTVGSTLLHLVTDPALRTERHNTSVFTAVSVDFGIVGSAVAAATLVVGWFAKLPSVAGVAKPIVGVLVGAVVSGAVGHGLVRSYTDGRSVRVGSWSLWKQLRPVSLRTRAILPSEPSWSRSLTRVGNTLVRICQRAINFTIEAVNAGIRSQVRLANTVRRIAKMNAVRVARAVGYGLALLRSRAEASMSALLRSARIVGLGAGSGIAFGAFCLWSGERALRYMLTGALRTGLGPAVAAGFGAACCVLVISWVYTAVPIRELIVNVERLVELGFAGALLTFVASAWVVGLTRAGRPLHVGILTLVATPLALAMVGWSLFGGQGRAASKG